VRKELIGGDLLQVLLTVWGLDRQITHRFLFVETVTEK
jgi:hypothetical protein